MNEEQVKEALRAYIAGTLDIEDESTIPQHEIDAIFDHLTEENGTGQDALDGIMAALTNFTGEFVAPLTEYLISPSTVTRIKEAAKPSIDPKARVAIFDALERAGLDPVSMIGLEGFKQALDKVTQRYSQLKDAAVDVGDDDLSLEDLATIADAVVKGFPTEEQLIAQDEQNRVEGETTQLRLLRALAAQGLVPEEMSDAFLKKIQETAREIDNEIARQTAEEGLPAGGAADRETIIAQFASEFPTEDEIAREVELEKGVNPDTFREVAVNSGRATETPSPDQEALMEQAFALAEKSFDFRRASGDDITFAEVASDILNNLPSGAEITRQIESRFGHLPPGFNPAAAASEALERVNQRIGKRGEALEEKKRQALLVAENRATFLGLNVDEAFDDPEVASAMEKFDTASMQQRQREAGVKTAQILRDNPNLANAVASGNLAALEKEFDAQNPGARNISGSSSQSVFQDLAASQARQFPKANGLDLAQFPGAQPFLATAGASASRAALEQQSREQVQLQQKVAKDIADTQQRKVEQEEEERQRKQRGPAKLTSLLRKL
jgi:hypothetical protein